MKFLRESIHIIVCAQVLFAQTVFSKSIIIFFALPSDVTACRKQLEDNAQNARIQIIDSKQYLVNGHRVHFRLMGSGAVNTAISTTQALGEVAPSEMFSCGPVGNLNHAFSPGTTVLVERVVAYQNGSKTPMGISGNSEYYPHYTNSWIAQESVTNFARVSCASGEMFIADDTEAETIHERTACDCVDMNLFGLEQARIRLMPDIPALHLRVVSDFADSAASDDFSNFINAYQGGLGQFLAELILQMPEAQDDPLSYPALRELITTNK